MIILLNSIWTAPPPLIWGVPKRKSVFWWIFPLTLAKCVKCEHERWTGLYLDPLPPPRGTYSPESKRFSLRPNFRPLGDPPPREPLGMNVDQAIHQHQMCKSYLPLVGRVGTPPAAPCRSCIMAWACAYPPAF